MKLIRPRSFPWTFALFATLFLISAPYSIRAAEPFSFLVTGDSRTEPFLPYGSGQEPRIRELLDLRYSHKPLQLSYGDDGMLRQVMVGAVGDKQQLRLSYRNGWPERIDALEPDGEEQRILDRGGRMWGFDNLVRDIQAGAAGNGPTFIVHGGDITLNGFQGRSLAESPFWQLFNSLLLMRLPAADDGLGLPARLFSTVGNHETWGDPQIEGMLSTFPWLQQFGLSAERRIYAFSYRNNRFIFLDTGDYCPGGTCWASKNPGFDDQMAFLRKQLNQARDAGEHNAFVIYHKPSFVQVGHDPLPDGQNPHPVLRQYAKDMNILVFNSHTHTTERYEVDGVHYQVMGGGGAPQAFAETEHPSSQEELYWQGRPRAEEYNYLRVDVDGAALKVTLHRYRPPQEPEWVELFTVSRKNQ